MSEFKILTFKEISNALNAGKHVEVEGCGKNPFKLDGGFLVDGDETPYVVVYDIYKAMTGLAKARIIEPKLTRWIIVCWISGRHETITLAAEENPERVEERYKKEGRWVRTVRVEV
jgi:hypothetical protein